MSEVKYVIDTEGSEATVHLPLALGKVLLAISEERANQDQLVRKGKFSWNCAFDGPPYAEKLAVLMEEVGEVSREVVEHVITRDAYAADEELKAMPPHREDYFRERLRAELVQVAAVCVAWCEHLSGAESAVQKGLEVKSHKFGIMHPSDRPLGLSFEGEEVWGADDRPVLFDTEEAARAHIVSRAARWPSSDWKDALVARYTPGLPKVYPRWDVLEKLEPPMVEPALSVATCPRCHGTKECEPWGDSDRDDVRPCNFCQRTGLVTAAKRAEYVAEYGEPTLPTRLRKKEVVGGAT